MIINTGQRTDIPAFYADWFANRLREGFVCVRNPFDHQQVSRYRLTPSCVDIIGFCTKNPEPMFPYMNLLKDYGQFWYMTITPYSSDIELNVPDKHYLLDVFKKLSKILGGPDRIGWRYDPIFITGRYTKEYHLHAFEQMAKALAGYTDIVVISFIDLYEKVKRNFPEVKNVSHEDKLFLGENIIKIAGNYGMTVKPCAEGAFLGTYGADVLGCMTVPMYERAIGQKLIIPRRKPNRPGCACYLASDIGAYDTCRHFCRYCYANNDLKMVTANAKRHNPNSPFLIGDYEVGDRIHDVEEGSWIDPQLSLF